MATQMNINSLLNVGNSIFTPNIRPTATTQLSKLIGITKKLVVYTWPLNNSLSADDKLLVLSFLTPFVRSKSESITQWSSWMFSFIALCFDTIPELVLQRNSNEYTVRYLEKNFIYSILNLQTILLSDEKSSDAEEYVTALGQLSFPSEFPEIEVTHDVFSEYLLPSRTIPSIYGFCSLLIFLCGKQINEKNLSTLTDARPKNLIDTYAISEPSSYVLRHPNVHSLESAQRCNKAWSYHYAMRKTIISEVAKFGSGESFPCRVVYTVSKLLEYVGMQQAFYIHKFLLANPQCREYTCLQSSLAAYQSSMMQLKNEEPHIIPYFKVIHADSTKIFHRNSILPLAAVAITYELRNNVSIKNYNLGPGMISALEMFEQEAKVRGHTDLCFGFANHDEDKI